MSGEGVFRSRQHRPPMREEHALVNPHAYAGQKNFISRVFQVRYRRVFTTKGLARRSRK